MSLHPGRAEGTHPRFSRRTCAGARDLNQRSIGRVHEPGIGVGAPKIPDGAIIGDIALHGGVNFARIW
jgi:hypothetical protein